MDHEEFGEVPGGNVVNIGNAGLLKTSFVMELLRLGLGIQPFMIEVILLGAG